MPKGIDKPDSPVWGHDKYWVPQRAKSARLVHGDEDGQPLCLDHPEGVKESDGYKDKDSSTIPDGFFNVCKTCHRIEVN